MLPHPSHHDHPFPYFWCADAFSEEACALLEHLFALERTWQRHEGAFYRCFLRDITAELQRSLVQDVVDRMRRIEDYQLDTTFEPGSPQEHP